MITPLKVASDQKTQVMNNIFCHLIRRTFETCIVPQASRNASKKGVSKGITELLTTRPNFDSYKYNLF